MKTIKKQYASDLYLDVQDYSLQELDDTASFEVERFEFDPIEKVNPAATDEHQKRIRIERGVEYNSSFGILPAVRKYRGLVAQEQDDFKNTLNKKVTQQVDTIKEDAFAQGLKQGHEKGKEEVKEILLQEATKKIEHFDGLIRDLLDERSALGKRFKWELLELVKSLTKWVIHKEIKEESTDYLERLLEKLLEESKVRSNVVIKVHKTHYDKVPEIIPKLEEKLGKLSGVRFEIDNSVEEYGLILESENMIIDGSLNRQFETINSVFEGLIK